MQLQNLIRKVMRLLQWKPILNLYPQGWSLMLRRLVTLMRTTGFRRWRRKGLMKKDQFTLWNRTLETHLSEPKSMTLDVPAPYPPTETPLKTSRNFPPDLSELPTNKVSMQLVLEN